MGDLGFRAAVHGALVGAEDVLNKTIEVASGGGRLTDDELLAQYEPMRGNARAILGYTAQRVGDGPHVIEEAARYEEQMEKLWAALRPSDPSTGSGYDRLGAGQAASTQLSTSQGAAHGAGRVRTEAG